MNKDTVNEIRMIFAWNLPKMATFIPFDLFNSKIVTIYLKNFKSKNRFIREDSISSLGEILNSLLNKKSSEMSQIFSSESNIFKIIDSYFNIPQLIKKFQSYAKKNILKSNIKFLNKILLIQNMDSWSILNKFMDKLDVLDVDSVEIAKIEIARQFGELMKCIPKKQHIQFLQRIKQEYLVVGPKTSAKTRETTLSVLSSILKELD